MSAPRTEGLAQGKLGGHPIHMMLLHFPAALLPIAAGYAVAWQFLKFDLGSATLYLLWPGIVLGWLAGLFGIWDLTRLPAGSKEMSVALVHGGINVTSLLAFSYVLWITTTTRHTPSMTETIIEVVAAVLMLVGNRYGGELVLRYGIGRLERQ